MLVRTRFVSFASTTIRTFPSALVDEVRLDHLPAGNVLASTQSTMGTAWPRAWIPVRNDRDAEPCPDAAGAAATISSPRRAAPRNVPLRVLRSPNIGASFVIDNGDTVSERPQRALKVFACASALDELDRRPAREDQAAAVVPAAVEVVPACGKAAWKLRDVRLSHGLA